MVAIVSRPLRLLFFIFMSSPAVSYCQQDTIKDTKDVTDTSTLDEPIVYKGKDVKSIADSVLLSLLGDAMFTHCKYTKKGVYSYVDPTTGKKHWAALKRHKKVKTPLVDINLAYKMDYPYPQCEGFDRIRGMIFLKLDSNLTMPEKPNLNFIPDFVWNGSDCNLMTQKQAYKLAVDNGFKESNKGNKAEVSYDPKVHQFYWTITNMIQRDSSFHKDLLEQTILINAGTKKIVSRSQGPATPRPQR